MLQANSDSNLYVVLAINPLFVKGVNRSHTSSDNPAYRQQSANIHIIPLRPPMNDSDGRIDRSTTLVHTIEIESKR